MNYPLNLHIELIKILQRIKMCDEVNTVLSLQGKRKTKYLASKSWHLIKLVVLRFLET
jgi:hypothetical protein